MVNKNFKKYKLLFSHRRRSQLNPRGFSWKAKLIMSMHRVQRKSCWQRLRARSSTKVCNVSKTFTKFLILRRRSTSEDRSCLKGLDHDVIEILSTYCKWLRLISAMHHRLRQWTIETLTPTWRSSLPMPVLFCKRKPKHSCSRRTQLKQWFWHCRTSNILYNCWILRCKTIEGRSRPNSLAGNLRFLPQIYVTVITVIKCYETIVTWNWCKFSSNRSI